MGLSVEHIKLVSQFAEAGDYILIEEWESECNVPLSEYEQHITDVKTYSFDFELGIFQNDRDYEEYRRLNYDEKFEKVFVGDLDEKLKDQIESYINTKGLTKLKRLDMGVDAAGIIHQVISFGEPKYEKGFYFVTVGFQKGGMVNEFWEDFAQYSFYGMKIDFEKAYYLTIENNIKSQSKTVSESLLENFKVNFLDKFEYGKSLLAV